MNASNWVRRIHRWLSALFMLLVVIVTIALSQEQPAIWISYLPLLPLFLLMLSGLYLFVLPYATKWRTKRD